MLNIMASISLLMPTILVLLSCLRIISCFVADNTCQNKPDGLYRHGSSCKRFIHCAHGRPYYQVCPIFKEFNERTKVCDIPANAKCNIRLAGPSRKTTRNNSCQNGRYAVFPHPEDCRSYIVCINGKKIKKKCRTGLRFHRKYKVCVYGKATDCIKKPFCKKLPDGTYSHPKTCKSYIICSRGNTLVKNCPPLMVFDVIEKRCGWRWKSICRGGISVYPKQGTKRPEMKSTLNPTASINNVSPPLRTVNSQNAIKDPELKIKLGHKISLSTKYPTSKIIPVTTKPDQIITSTAKPLNFLQRLKFAVAKDVTKSDLPNGPSVKTYIISGQGYPAVPKTDKRYELMEKLKRLRINLHGFPKPEVMAAMKSSYTPVKVLDITYETSTLQPALASKKEAASKNENKDGTLKAKQELKNYINAMKAQVDMLSRNQMSADGKSVLRESAGKDAGSAFKRRRILSQLIKKFLKDRLQYFHPTLPENPTKGKPRIKPWLFHKMPYQTSYKATGQIAKPKQLPVISPTQSQGNKGTTKRLGNLDKHFSKATQFQKINPQLPELKNKKGFVGNKMTLNLQKYVNRHSAPDLIAKHSHKGPHQSRFNGKYSFGSGAAKRLASPNFKLLSFQQRLRTICSTVFDPVCGSDFQTYFNDCHLAVTSCSRDRTKSIKKLHDGPCTSRL